MRAMKAIFRVDGGIVHFERINLTTDGAESIVTGDADIAHWPEQTYRVKSVVDFHRMRELFFANENYTLSGEGRFDGVFHLFKGGRSLTGSFESEVAGLRCGGTTTVSGAEGQARLAARSVRRHRHDERVLRRRRGPRYSIAPPGSRQPANATFDAEWQDVDLAAFTDFMQMSGLRFAGRWSGRNRLEWPLGHFASEADDGRFEVVPPAGADVLAGTRASDVASGPIRAACTRASATCRLPASVTYRYDRDWV